MSRFKIIQTAALAALASATLLPNAGVALAQEGHQAGRASRGMETLIVPSLLGSPASRDPSMNWSAYIEDAARTRSGNVWLMATGRDPRLTGLGAPLRQGGAGALVPYRDPSAKFSRNVLIPRDFSTAPLQTEPHLAVNPKDPNHIVAGMIDYNFPAVSTYVSIDGGVTWEGPTLIKQPREEIASAGDPVLAFDRDGNVHYIFISLDTEEFTLGNILGQATVSSISMASSTDGGYTWSGSAPTSRSKVETQLFTLDGGQVRGEVGFEFLDKPWLAIGPDPQDPSRDIMYVTYTKFISRYSVFYLGELPTLAAPVEETVIEAVSSRDGGITWSDPVEVSPRLRQVILPSTRGDAPADEGTDPAAVEGGDAIAAPGGQVVEARRRIVQGSQPAVAPDGTVYVAWLDTTDDAPFEGLAQLYVARSDDGGRTFTPGRRATTFLEPGFSPRSTFFRYWGSSFAQLAVGPDGTVYLAYVGLPSGKPGDDGDVYLVSSTNKGQAWSAAVTVNDDRADGLQFFPSISVAPNGNVHLMWGDTRDDPMNLRYHIYYAMSEDGGASFGLNARVTDSYSNPNFGFPSGQFIGDYFSIQATSEDVYMVWADARVGEFQGINQKIGFARQRQMPNPSIFLSPAQGPAATDVTIQGFNYQPDQVLYIQVGGSIVAQERTSPQGRFTTQLFFPIAGEGAQTVTVLDASGNVATASFFNEFGFDNIAQAAGDIESLQTNFGGQGVGADIASIKATLAEVRANQRPFSAGGMLALGVVALIAVVAGAGGSAGFWWWRNNNGNGARRSNGAGDGSA